MRVAGAIRNRAAAAQAGPRSIGTRPAVSKKENREISNLPVQRPRGKKLTASGEARWARASYLLRFLRHSTYLQSPNSPSASSSPSGDPWLFLCVSLRNTSSKESAGWISRQIDITNITWTMQFVNDKVEFVRASERAINCQLLPLYSIA